MKIEKQIRFQAKDALKDNWISPLSGLFLLIAVNTLLVTLVYTAGFFMNIFTDEGELKSGCVITYTIIVCSSVLIAVLISPLKNGFMKICYKLSNGEEADYGDMFYFFSGNKYFQTLQFNLILAVKIIINILIGLIPFFILNITAWAFSLQLLTTVTANEIFSYANITLFVLGIIIAVLLSVKIIVSEFIFIDNDADDLAEVFAASRNILKKHKRDINNLFYSFILWIALCFFVFPALYVIPYITTAFATSSKWLIKLNKEGNTV